MEADPDADAVETELVRELATQRTVSLRFVLRAYDIALKTGAITEQSSTADWAKRFLIPCTSRTQLSWAQHTAERHGLNVQPAKYHVVHSWSGEARALVIGVAQAANFDGPEPRRITDLLQEKWHADKSPSNLDVHFFICPFSINQHTVQQYTEGAPPLHRPEIGNPRCEIDKFPKVGKAICERPETAMVLVLDEQRVALTRSCCLEELHAAITNRPEPFELRILGSGRLDMLTVDVLNAGAHDPTMKASIDARIERNPGIQAFNQTIKNHYQRVVEARTDTIDLLIGEGITDRKPFALSSLARDGCRLLFAAFAVNLSYGVLEQDPELSADICSAIEGAISDNIPGGLHNSRTFLGPGSTKILVQLEMESNISLGVAWLLLDVAAHTGFLQLQITKNIEAMLDKIGSAVFEPLSSQQLEFYHCHFDSEVDVGWKTCYQWEPQAAIQTSKAALKQRESTGKSADEPLRASLGANIPMLVPATASRFPQLAVARQCDGHEEVALKLYPVSGPEGQLLLMIPNGSRVEVIGPCSGEYVEITMKQDQEVLRGWVKQTNLQVEGADATKSTKPQAREGPALFPWDRLVESAKAKQPSEPRAREASWDRKFTHSFVLSKRRDEIVGYSLSGEELFSVPSVADALQLRMTIAEKLHAPIDSLTLYDGESKLSGVDTLDATKMLTLRRVEISAHPRVGHTAWVMHFRDELWEKIKDAIERQYHERGLDREKPDHMSNLQYYLRIYMTEGDLIYVKRDWDRQIGYTLGQEITFAEPKDLAKFPGYSVFYPISMTSWKLLFARWFVGACLKLSFLISSLTLCVELLEKSVAGYNKNPVLCDLTLAVISFSIFWEACLTIKQTYQGHKRIILDAMEVNCLTAIRDVLGYFVLRFFEVPHEILNASENMNRMNLLRNNTDTLGLPPLCFCLSKAMYRYNKVSGTRKSTSTLILRNIFATIFKLVLLYRAKAEGVSPVLTLSIMAAALSFWKSTRGWHFYTAAVTSLYNELQSHIEYIAQHADKKDDWRWFDLAGIQKSLPVKYFTDPEGACFPPNSRCACLRPYVLPFALWVKRLVARAGGCL